MRTRREVDWEISRLEQWSTKPRAVRQVAHAMRWVLGLEQTPLSERLLPYFVGGGRGTSTPAAGPVQGATRPVTPNADRKDET